MEAEATRFFLFRKHYLLGTGNVLSKNSAIQKLQNPSPITCDKYGSLSLFSDFIQEFDMRQLKIPIILIGIIGNASTYIFFNLTCSPPTYTYYLSHVCTTEFLRFSTYLLYATVRF